MMIKRILYLLLWVVGFIPVCVLTFLASFIMLIYAAYCFIVNGETETALDWLDDVTVKLWLWPEEIFENECR